MSTEPTSYVQKVKPVYVDALGNELVHPIESVPYIEAFYPANFGLIADGGTGQLDFTALAHWGVGLNFILKRIGYYFRSTIPSNDDEEDNILLTLRIAGNPFFYYNQLKESFVESSGGDWELAVNIADFLPVYVLAASKIRENAYNESGSQLKAYSLIVLSGVGLT